MGRTERGAITKVQVRVSILSSFFSDHNAGTDKKEKEKRYTPIDLSSLPPRYFPLTNGIYPLPCHDLLFYAT